MPHFLAIPASRRVLHVLTAVLMASAVSACSDSSRFGESPFANPFASAPSSKVDMAQTNSIPNRAAPLSPVSSQPLPSALPSTSTLSAPTMSNAAVRPAPVTGSAAGWSAQGGTPVTVAPGDTAQSLSNRYGVPASAILAANGGRIMPGQQATIPVFGGAQRAASLTQPSFTQPTLPQPSAPKSFASPLLRPQAAAQVPMANPVPKAPLLAQARPLVTAAAKPAASDDDDDEDDKPQGRIVPASPKTAVTPSASKPVVIAPKPVAQTAPPAQRFAQVQPAKPVAPPKAEARPQPRVIPMTSQAEVVPVPAPKMAEAPKADPTPTNSISPSASGSSDKSDFRWPAKGRVISGFGSKTGNGDGISIAVPEGTSVKAADGGTVAYAGEELKGYGKLVLIRHENGFVTAYAHNSDVAVKRGDKVSRGQMIAKSGSTGNVTSPQLHFEVRKGSTPVDPAKYLD
jgi:murein DD-endopeptidase MepM/ murein hydrolase activator NlpD